MEKEKTEKEEEEGVYIVEVVDGTGLYHLRELIGLLF